MNRDDLINAMGQVDDDLYEAADVLRQQPLPANKKNHAWVRWAAMAACLCVVGAGALIFMGRGGSSSMATESMMAVAEASTEADNGQNRSVTDEDSAGSGSEDAAMAESAIAPEMEQDASAFTDNSINSFSVPGAAEADGGMSITAEIIIDDRDMVLQLTDTAQADAVLSWLSESGALTAGEFTAQYGSLTDRANWPSAVTILTITPADGSAEAEVWYVPAELPQDLY